ncbi:outer membrane lipoprotein-sorting protein [Corallococcus sp. CA053C]|uniref:outer membrane lipoprotein-sorting protein n=1 Tax=Corallococcus sp. CA053C TaxID=2316732 RepID=UPI000EA2BAF7|nr:outer membrane lipoprotein-sorting protein [Corallococcus sp. CA053C]RKH13333.1 outer membrane lipoprotein-sorting protein [Corallococcus sp. CA053C]
MERSQHRGTATRRLLLGSALALVLGTPGIGAAADNAQDLMRKSDKLHRLKSEQLHITLSLEEQGGTPRKLSLESLYETDADGAEKLRMRFDSPADVKGTTLLSVDPVGEPEAEQWLYLPAFRKTRQLGASDLKDRFVNSDLWYEDLKQRDVDDFAYTLTGSEKLGGVDCHVVEGKPARESVAKDSPYGKVQVWLRKDNLMQVRMRYFDKQLQPVKSLEGSKLTKVSDTAWRTDVMTIVDLKRKHRTVVTVDSRQVNPTLPADTFSRHALAGP